MAPDYDLDRLAAATTINLTTFGRRSGSPSRIEIWWFRVGGRFIITGTPGPRDWYANVLADPRIVVHVDGWDIAARAEPVTDAERRREVFTHPDVAWYATQARFDELVAAAPMIEIEL